MKGKIAVLLTALTLFMSASALAVEPVSLSALLDSARRDLTRAEVEAFMGVPQEDTGASMTYFDPLNGVRTQFGFVEDRLDSVSVVATYTAETVDVMYVHFLYYEAELMELLSVGPSFANYVGYEDPEIVKARFDGGMYGWYDVNGGDIYVGATFDSGAPLIYISCSGLLP